MEDLICVRLEDTLEDRILGPIIEKARNVSYCNVDALFFPFCSHAANLVVKLTEIFDKNIFKYPQRGFSKEYPMSLDKIGIHRQSVCIGVL